MFELAQPRRLELPRRMQGSSPEIIPRGDVVIFGLVHTVTQVPPEERQKVVSQLRTCDYLLMEGTTRTQTGIFKHDTHAYEKLLVESVRDKTSTIQQIYQLEEGCNVYDLVDSYGLDKSSMASFILLSQYVDPIVFAPNLGAAKRAVKDGIRNGIRIQEDTENLDYPRIEKQLLNFFRRKGMLPSNINERMLANMAQIAGNTAIVYRGFLSEYEFMGPNIRRFVAELPGRKGISVGKAHLEMVEKALENEEFAKPPPWDEFVERLDTVRKGSIEISRILMDME